MTRRYSTPYRSSRWRDSIEQQARMTRYLVRLSSPDDPAELRISQDVHDVRATLVADMGYGPVLEVTRHYSRAAAVAHYGATPYTEDY